MPLSPLMRGAAAGRLVLVWALLLSAGCGRLLADRIVQAPNTTREYADYFARTGGDALADQVDRRMDVSVGPPPATLSVAVVEPYTGRVEIRFVRKGEGGTLTVGTSHTPATTQPAATARGTVFVLHGIYDRKDSPFSVLWGAVLSQAGYRAVLVDFRGHGDSTGKWITYGVVESRDLTQVADALEAESLLPDGRVGVFGVSYGAAVAIEWAAADPRVAAVVAAAPFATFRDAVYDFAPFALGRWRALVSDGTIRSATDWAGRLAGFNPDDASPLDAISRTRAPVLLVHGTADAHLPPSHSQRLHDAAPDHSELYLVEGADHLTLTVLPIQTLRPRVVGWFNRWLAEPP